MAELVLHRYGEPLLRLPVDRDRFRVGRGTGNDLVIPDDGVSLDEAIFELRPEGWWVLDASGRGTVVDAGVIEAEAPLTDGAIVQFGDRWRVGFHLGLPTSPGETRRHARQTLLGSSEALSSAPITLRWTTPLGQQSLKLEPSSVAGVGGDDDNLIVIDDEYVSAFHARIFRSKGAWRITDLSSTNGTFLDDVRIVDAVIEPGMRVRVGQTEIRVEPPSEHHRDTSFQYGIVTADPALLELMEQLTRLGSTDATVTIFGESGTGKELVARAVHDSSDRASKAFIPVNCAAISKELMESELFGHEKGAFTGATSARSGAFEEASGGTLFLDEVGELPLDLQAKLLRAIENKEIRRVGASRPINVDVRIVAATNRDLHQEVRAGRFREDLFYRLFVVPLTLPPLRQRRGDVLLLAEHFIRTRSLGRAAVLTEAAKERLLSHAWPGNVRELRNAIERAILFHGGGRIEARDITFPCLPVSSSECTIDPAGKTLAEIEREAIDLALRSTGGNRRVTARLLGIARSTLQNKLKELGLNSNEGSD